MPKEEMKSMKNFLKNPQKTQTSKFRAEHITTILCEQKHGVKFAKKKSGNLSSFF